MILCLSTGVLSDVSPLCYLNPLWSTIIKYIIHQHSLISPPLITSISIYIIYGERTLVTRTFVTWTFLTWTFVTQTFVNRTFMPQRFVTTFLWPILYRSIQFQLLSKSEVSAHFHNQSSKENIPLLLPHPQYQQNKLKLEDLLHTF